MSGKSAKKVWHKLTWRPISNNDYIYGLNLIASRVIASILMLLSNIQASEIISKDDIKAMPNRGRAVGVEASEILIDGFTVLEA